MFRDRTDAGRQLGEALRRFEGEHPILLGLLRGGLPVAAEATGVLGADLDALVVRKAAPPEDREFGDGAVAPGGIEVGHAPEAEVEKAKGEMRDRIDRLLDGHLMPDIRGRTVILVDDGLATGVTALAAIRYARTLGPAKIVMAVPVLSEEALRAVAAEADATVYLVKPEPFHAVGDVYQSFEEVSDETVRDLLA